jgi:TatD DNase family protein
MIDLHCHLDLYPQPAAIVEECARRNMYVLSVTTTPSAWIGTSALAAGNERIRTAIGLHPQLARQRKGELAQFDELIHETRYVGEIGLDGTPECKPFWEDQVAVFEHVLQTCALAGGRILTIHSRRAEKDVMILLERNRTAGTPILHWFSGSLRSLEEAIRLDCWYSVGPAMLRSLKGRDLVGRMPSDRVLTETDGPFAMFGDRAIQPWDVEDAVNRLAEIWQVSAQDVEQRLALNLRLLVQSEPPRP